MKGHCVMESPLFLRNMFTSVLRFLTAHIQICKFCITQYTRFCPWMKHTRHPFKATSLNLLFISHTGQYILQIVWTSSINVESLEVLCSYTGEWTESFQPFLAREHSKCQNFVSHTHTHKCCGHLSLSYHDSDVHHDSVHSGL